MTTNNNINQALRVASWSWSTTKRIVLIAAAAALLVASPLFVRSVSAGSPCNNGHVCVYDYINRGGSQYNHYQPVLYTCYNLPSSWNDRVSSIDSKVANYIIYFQTGNCGAGLYTTVQPNDYRPSLPWWIDNQISAYCRGC